MSSVRLLAATAALALVVGLLSGCGGTAASPDASGPAATDEAGSLAPPDSGLHVGTYRVVGTPRVTVATDRGSFVVELSPDKAPNTVSSFLELVSGGFYDGLRVHRVEAGFVMQVGDPQTKGFDAKQVADIVQRAKQQAPLSTDPPLGSGDPGWSMKAEPSDLTHERGVIAMARSQDPDSAGSQFYVTLAPAHALDGGYTVFGRVVSGMDVVDALQVGDAIKTMTIATGN